MAALTRDEVGATEAFIAAVERRFGGERLEAPLVRERTTPTLHLDDVDDARSAAALADAHQMPLAWSYGDADEPQRPGVALTVSLRGARWLRCRSDVESLAWLASPPVGAQAPGQPPREVTAHAGARLEEIEAYLRRRGSSLGETTAAQRNLTAGGWYRRWVAATAGRAEAPPGIPLTVLAVQWVRAPKDGAEGVLAALTLRCEPSAGPRRDLGWTFVSGDEALEAMRAATQHCPATHLRCCPLSGLERAERWLRPGGERADWRDAMARVWPGLAVLADGIADAPRPRGWLIIAGTTAEAGVAAVELARLDRLMADHGATPTDPYVVAGALRELPDASVQVAAVARRNGCTARLLSRRLWWREAAALLRVDCGEGRWLAFTPTACGAGVRCDEWRLLHGETATPRGAGARELPGARPLAAEPALPGRGPGPFAGEPGASERRDAWTSELAPTEPVATSGRSRDALIAPIARVLGRRDRGAWADAYLDGAGAPCDDAAAAALDDAREAVRRRRVNADARPLAVVNPRARLWWHDDAAPPVLMATPATAWREISDAKSRRGVGLADDDDVDHQLTVHDVLVRSAQYRSVERGLGIPPEQAGLRDEIVGIGTITSDGALRMCRPLGQVERAATITACEQRALTPWLVAFAFGARVAPSTWLWRGSWHEGCDALCRLAWRLPLRRAIVRRDGTQGEVWIRVAGSGTLARRALDLVQRALPGVRRTDAAWPCVGPVTVAPSEFEPGFVAPAPAVVAATCFTADGWTSLMRAAP